ncbi:hypothetical protein LINPERPRIM_LOCUS34299 [Linum perenne]|jgi:transposase
MMR